MMQQNIVKCVMSCLIAGAACPAVVGMGEYVYSSNEYAFAPRDVEFQSAGLEYYATDSVGGQYTGKEGSVPVFFCKYGNMIATNVASYEKPWLWKTGNAVVVHTGDEGDSPYKAHSKIRVVVMDAEAGELLVADVSEEGLRFMDDVRRVDLKDHVVCYYDEKGGAYKIPVKVKCRLSPSAQIENRRVIESAVKRGAPQSSYPKVWIDPATGLEWNYVDVDDGAEICNTRTGGTAVAPKPRGMVAFPGKIDGKPVKCIGSNAILHCPVEKAHIPKTVERFSESAAYSLFNNSILSVEVESGSRMFRSENGLLYDASGSVLLFVPCGLSKVEIPSSVTNISDFAFQHCEHIKRIVIPSGVQEIGRWAFSQSGIKEVRFLGDAPKVPTNDVSSIYFLTATSLKTFARKDANGWRVNGELPMMWCGRPIVFE